MDLSYAFIAIAAVAAVLLFLLLKTYNGLIKMRNAVQSGWSDIDVQLTRRHDLVPNLVEAVKGYMTHERETLEAVTRARTEAVSAAGGADGHREPHRLCPAALQRMRKKVQHGAGGVSAQPDRWTDGIYSIGVVCGGCGRQGECAGKSLKALAADFRRWAQISH